MRSKILNNFTYIVKKIGLLNNIDTYNAKYENWQIDKCINLRKIISIES